MAIGQANFRNAGVLVHFAAAGPSQPAKADWDETFDVQTSTKVLNLWRQAVKAECETFRDCGSGL